MGNTLKMNDKVIKAEKNKIKIWEYAAMLLMFYLTDSGIAKYGANTIYYISMLTFIAFAGIIFFMFIGKRYFSRTFFVFSLIGIWVGAYSIIIGSGVGQTARYVSLLIIALYISFAVPFEKFMKIFTDVCFFLASAAVLMWIVTFIFPEIYDILPIIELKSNISSSNEMFEYRTIFFANMHKSDYTLLDRIYSIFWEPGACQAYFNIALIYTARFMQGKKRIIYSIIFIVAVVLTLSTGGYFALIFAIGLLLSFGENNIKNLILKSLVIILLVVFVFLFISNQDSEIFISVFGKLSEGSDHQSVASRLNSITGNLYLLRDNFFMGVGLNNSSYALEQYGIFTNQTNTILDYFATFGFIVGSIYTVCWLFFVGKLGKSIIQKLLILGAFVCIFFSEDYITSLHFYILMMYGARFWLDGIKEPLEEGCL